MERSAGDRHFGHAFRAGEGKEGREGPVEAFGSGVF
jgi:hypothetical protein